MKELLVSRVTFYISALKLPPPTNIRRLLFDSAEVGLNKCHCDDVYLKYHGGKWDDKYHGTTVILSTLRLVQLQQVEGWNNIFNDMPVLM